MSSVQQAFNISQASNMVDELLKVLRLKQIGKKVHANQIDQVYRKKMVTMSIVKSASEVGMVHKSNPVQNH